jgi:hypothetical protein
MEIQYLFQPQRSPRTTENFSGRRSLESGAKEGIFSTMKELKGMKGGASRKLRPAAPEQVADSG